MSKRNRNRSLGRVGPTPTSALPTFATRAPLAWAEVPPPPGVAGMMVNGANSYVRTYTLGECSVIVTKEYGDWHMSISHHNRYPGWDEVAEARYNAIPDGVTMAMILPPMGEYINKHENCFQLHEVRRAGPDGPYTSPSIGGRS